MLVLGAGTLLPASAQPFASTHLVPVLGSVDWGDYDADGDPDLILTGTGAAEVIDGERVDPHVAVVYRNEGSGYFTDIQASLTGVRYGTGRWGDYDADGDLDLVIAGEDIDQNRTATIYRNDGNDAFTDIGAGIAGLRIGAADWGDYDNDGDLDLMVVGEGTTSAYAILYRNEGNDSFVDSGLDFGESTYGSLDWGDYDQDGDVDLILAGGQFPVATIYRNNGDGSFTDVEAGLTGVSGASVEWGDYDGDGDLDLTVTGGTAQSGSSPSAAIYRNEGGDVFSDIGADLGSVPFGPHGSWGDYDGDGDLDVFVAGVGLFRNTAGTFTNAGVDIVTGGRAASGWADFDQDGDQDLVVTSERGRLVPSTVLYRNDGDRVFTDTRLEALPEAAGSPSLSIAWGDYDADTDLDLAVSSVGAFDRVGQTTVYRNDGRRTFVDAEAGIGRGAAVSWVDFDSDADLDLAVPNIRNLSGGAIFQNEGNDTFTTIEVGILNSGFNDLQFAYSMDWGDYDNDGDPDLIISGGGFTGGQTTRLYRNEGDATFTQVDAAFTGVDSGEVAWGDYDQDGDLDIVLTGMGFDGSTRFEVATIYRNDGGSVFTDIDAGLVEVGWSSVDWGDYDGDGDLDLVVTGDPNAAQASVPGYSAFIYRNDGNDTFTDAVGLKGVRDGSSDWGDYDGDGDLDVIVAGETSDGGVRTTLYRNDGGDAFTAVDIPFIDVTQSQARWGDYDGDGDLDLVLGGASSTVNAVVVYENLRTSTATAREPDLELATGSDLTVYPFPTSDRARIQFDVSVAGPVRLAVFNVLGQRVQEVRLGGRTPGQWTETIDASTLPSGLYFVRLTTAGGQQTTPFVVAR